MLQIEFEERRMESSGEDSASAGSAGWPTREKNFSKISRGMIQHWYSIETGYFLVSRVDRSPSNPPPSSAPDGEGKGVGDDRALKLGNKIFPRHVRIHRVRSKKKLDEWNK
jgi:hypothetical protein